METTGRLLTKPFTFSQSSLQDYLDCPRRFQLKYIQQVQWPAVESVPYLENERRQIEGQIFHRMVQQYYLGLPPEKISPLASTDNLARWWNNFQSAVPRLPGYRIFTELGLSARIGGHRLTAKYDLVAVKENEARIIFDWKTYMRRPARTRMAERMQTKVYTSLMFEAGSRAVSLAPSDWQNVEMIYWYAEFPESPEKFSSNKSTLQQAWKQVEGLIREIDARQSFPLTEDKRACDVCTFRSLCERGIIAGETTELDSIDASEFIDFEQIQEIEF